MYFCRIFVESMKTIHFWKAYGIGNQKDNVSICLESNGSTTKGSRTKGSTTKGSRQKVHDRRFTTKRSRHKVHDKRFTTKGSRQKVHRRKVHKDSIEIDFLDGNNACFTANEGTIFSL